MTIDDKALDIRCPECLAAVGEHCRSKRRTWGPEFRKVRLALKHPHAERKDMIRRLEQLASDAPGKG